MKLVIPKILILPVIFRQTLEKANTPTDDWVIRQDQSQAKNTRGVRH
jgi:hypothetical protein